MPEEKDKAIETTSNTDEIIEYIESNKKLSEENDSTERERWEKDYQLYESNPDARPSKWMSNRFIPATFKTVEVILANIMGAIYSSNPPFDVKPRESGDIVQSRLIKNAMAFYFNHINMYPKIMDFVKQGLIYGTTYGKIYWEKVEEPRTTLEPEYGMRAKLGFPPFERFVKKYVAKRKKVVVKNNPIFETIDVRDMFLSPDSIDIQDGWAIHRSFRNYGYLLQNAEQNIYDKTAVESLKDVDISRDNDEYSATNRTQSRDDNIPKEKTNKLSHRIEILEFWGKVPRNWIEGGASEKEWISAVITLAGAPGEYKVIRRHENPFWHGQNPFVKATYVRKPKEAMGKGIPRIIGDLNLAMNDIVNSRNDNMMLALQKVFIGVTGEVKTDQKIFPGAILEEESSGSLRDLNLGNITPDAYRETFELERYLQEASGATKVTSGLGGGDAKELSQTATGMSLSFRAAATRMMMHAKLMEFEAVKVIMQRFYQLIYQKADQADIVRILGEKEGSLFEPKEPEEVFRDYDFIPLGTFTMENKDMKVQNYIAYLKIAGNTPYINQAELIKRIGIDGFGIDADDPIFPDEQQVEGNLQQMARQQQVLNPQPGTAPEAKPTQTPLAEQQAPANLAGGNSSKQGGL